MVSAFEIIIISVGLYYFLSFCWNTRAMDLIYGVLAFLVMFVITTWLRFPVLHKVMVNVANVAVIALIVIFQPELRTALSKLSVKGRKYREVSEFDTFLEDLSHSVYRFSERRIGALIVIENQDSLEEYANKAVRLNSRFSGELVETIFNTGSPLHDGAIIVRGTMILAAASILPLADDTSQLSKSIGTRHRAALGISQHTDALVIVVSEETGKVAIARDGIITRGVKMDRFKGILRSIFNPQAIHLERGLGLFGKWKEWWREWKI
jgi:diadenylate cyclase